MQHTANYGLKKPMGTDVVNIADLNDNADIIDQQLKENSDAVDTKETPAGAQAKADSAEAEAKAYADSITPTKVSQLTNDKGYIAESGAPVQSVNGKTGAVSLTAANVGAAPAAHVNDTTKHITSAERSAWNAKPSSQRGVSDSVSSTSSSIAASSKAVKTAYDKGVAAYNLASTKEAAFSKKTAFNKNFGTTSGTVCQGNDSRLSNSRKCNSTFDNASTARTNLGLTGTSNTTHYHDSRYVQTRVYNGKLQYYDGGWKDVGENIIQPTKPKTLTAHISKTVHGQYHTLLEVTGCGQILRVSAAASGNFQHLMIRVTIDGVSYTRPISSGGSCSLREGSNYADWLMFVYFKTGFKIELGHNYSGNTLGLEGTCDYSLV